MGRRNGDTQVDGQMDLFGMDDPQERLFAVSRVFARARKAMNLNEQKTLVLALSKLRFKERAEGCYVRIDKKELRDVLGIQTDSIHLSVRLFEAIKQMPVHSYVEIAQPDKELYASGVIITSVASFRNFIRIKFNPDFMGLFTGLKADYLTMWSGDIFQAKTTRVIQLYEYLRQATDTRKDVNETLLGVRFFKELFNIPREAYMRERGFNRTQFEKDVIIPALDGLTKTKMIRLVVQEDGSYYQKVKKGYRVDGYLIHWVFSSYPRTASAEETAQIQERVREDPRVLKVAKDLIKGEKKPKKKNSFLNFDQREHPADYWDELESTMFQTPAPGTDREEQ